MSIAPQIAAARLTGIVDGELVESQPEAEHEDPEEVAEAQAELSDSLLR